MKRCISAVLTQISAYVCPFWSDRIQEVFGIKCLPKEPETPLDPIILRQVYQIFSMMPVQLVKDCGVKELYISEKMGPSKSYYPNHGYFDPATKSVTLNADIFENPDTPEDFYDDNYHFVSRPCQTLLHEFGHAHDAECGELSMKEDWLKLSGWSKDAKPGLKQLVIDEPGMPRVMGEMFYNPTAKFTRFYARRSPWDDYADSFAYYFSGLRDKVPETKRNYFDKLLKKYSSK